jgi:sugar phosphate isomerase/epimerase
VLIAQQEPVTLLTNRRRFLATLVANIAGGRSALAVIAAGSAADCAAARPWGRRSEERLERIGLQLYTVRDALAKDFDGTLARIAAIGYRDVEFAGYVGRRPEEVSATLERHGLRAPSAHIPLDDLRNRWSAVVDAAHVIDHDFVVVPWLAEQERRTITDYERLAEFLNRAGRAARQADLRLAYHNHDFEFTPLGGRIPYDLLLDRTDPEAVEFEMDLYWVTKAGHDPVAYFDRYPDRFPLVHVKDSAGPPAHRMTEVGRGTIDFRRILAQRKQAGIEHAFVELDESADPLDSIRVSYEYLSRLTF